MLGAVRLYLIDDGMTGAGMNSSATLWRSCTDQTCTVRKLACENVGEVGRVQRAWRAGAVGSVREVIAAQFSFHLVASTWAKSGRVEVAV